MTYATVALFDHPDLAEKAMQQLHEAGFSNTNLEYIESDPESQSFFKRLFQKEGGEEMEAEKAHEYLTSAGIPEDDAQDYADQVKKGSSLLLVDSESEADAKRARRIIDDVLGREERDTDERPTGEPTRGRQRVEAAEEELEVGKKEVETGGVRVEKEVEEQEVEREVSLREEDVDVQRREVDRPLREGEEAFQEEEIEVSETREEPVVEKQPKVREEVEVGKEIHERPETIRETVLQEHINVEDVAQRARPRYEQFEPELRTHYEEHYGEGEFDDYSRGYRYGMALAEDDELRNRDWEEVEPEAGRQWESQETSNWDDIKEAVRYGWHKIRGKEEEYRRPSR